MTASKTRRIIVNTVSDHGWVDDPGVTLTKPEVVKKLFVDAYKGTPVDAVTWCIGGSEVYAYETNVGERFGEGYDDFEEEKDYWIFKNAEHPRDAPGGPLTEVSGQFRKAGIDFFPSVRMSAHYHTRYSSPHYGRFRREHPELLIGQPDEEIPAPTIENAIRHGIDYKFPEVRAHMLAIVFELFERFEVDGIELDYMRHPGYFRPEEALANRYLMTDLIRRIRQRMDEVGEERGRKLDLLVRVPPTLYDSKRGGLDVEAWIEEGLVDVVVAGGGFMPFEMPIQEFLAAAAGTDCQVYGSLEALRWSVDEEVLRALATRFWDAGVDGIYLFNYFSTPNKWKRQVLGEMVDKDRLPSLSKRYELDHGDRVAGKGGHHGAFSTALPRASLPIFMEETLDGGGPVLTLEIADDVDAAGADGSLDTCTLGLGFSEFGDLDELDVVLNGESLPWDTRQVSYDGWDHVEFGDRMKWRGATVVSTPDSPLSTNLLRKFTPGTLIRFEVSPPHLRKGANELAVRLIKGPHRHGPRGDTPRFRSKPVVLKEVRVAIRYK